MVDIVGKRGAKKPSRIHMRGNYTYGENRRGSRKPVYPEGTQTETRSILLSDAEWAKAVLLGNGNTATGVRRALKFTPLDARDKDAPRDRLGAWNFVRLRKIRERYENRTSETHTSDAAARRLITEALNNFGEESAADAGIDAGWDDLLTPGDHNDEEMGG